MRSDGTPIATARIALSDEDGQSLTFFHMYLRNVALDRVECLGEFPLVPSDKVSPVSGDSFPDSPGGGHSIVHATLPDSFGGRS